MTPVQRRYTIFLSVIAITITIFFSLFQISEFKDNKVDFKRSTTLIYKDTE